MCCAELLSPAPLERAMPSRQPPIALPTPATLPDIEPGQLWLIELPGGTSAAAPQLSRILDRANVAIYDRSLAATVAAALPPGGYAEAADDPGDKSAARSVRLARDGWSVVRLVPAAPSHSERAGRVEGVVAALAATRVPGDLAVRVFAEGAAGLLELATTRLDRLAPLIAAHRRETRLTIVIGAVGAAAARLHAVAGNGLAG